MTKTVDMEELSKSLEQSSKEHSPEQYIRRTLRAHGFFDHFQRPTPSSKKRATTMETRAVPGLISEEDKKRTTQLVSHYKEGKEFHTLREPRSVYARSSNPSQSGNSDHTLPFWPAEVNCIREKPKFLLAPPKFQEPYYTPKQEVVSPRIRSGDGYGKTVYLNLPGPEKFYIKSRRGPSLTLPLAMIPPTTDSSLQFESRFESGNLGKAVQVGRWDYELYLRHDLYTKKYTQWFFFRVRNMQSDQTYRFTIVNLYKAGSLYNDGMQPVFYSEKEARERKLGWHRVGQNLKYFKTSIKWKDKKKESYCYGVTWSHTFLHEDDTCYFAHSFPYTYSDLQEYLRKVLADREMTKFCKYKVLCRTIAGNAVPLLTITSPSLTPNDSEAKKGVVVSARIHPGETNASWMMKGLLDFLTSSSDDAKILRDLFVFKIIPMINPDGVIIGNYRCSLAGRDLNRNYQTKWKDSYPTVWHTKNLVKQFCKEREVVMFCDLHGHSRKHNVFIYGCDSLEDAATRLKSRVFPKMLSKNAPNMFSFSSSRFVVQKNKEGTGRVVMWREAGIQNSYTLEATFAGSKLGKLRGVQFSTAHLKEMGRHLCDTLLDYCDPDQSKIESIMEELREEYRKYVMSALASLGQELPPGVDPLDVEIDPALAEADCSDVGSDSSESDGPPVHIQWKKSHKAKKKKLKSRKERNKRKAMLKMNHQRLLAINPPPSNPLQPTAGVSTEKQSRKKAKSVPKEEKEEKKNEPKPNPPSDILSSSHIPSHIPSHSNGGIPLFIQERLVERQRKRDEEGDSVLGVKPEELRQALLHIQATHTQHGLSSTLFIPHPSCPMNISQVNMHELSRRQSKKNSKISLESGSLVPPELPSLIPASQRNAKGGFTSQYMAQHLQSIGAVQGGGVLPAPESNIFNSTRNLSNLSQLFRQLHPLAATHDPLSHLASQQNKETGSVKDQGRVIFARDGHQTHELPEAVDGNTRFYHNMKTYSSTLPNKLTTVASSEGKTENSCDGTSSGNQSRGSPLSTSSSTSSLESLSQEATLKQAHDATRRKHSKLYQRDRVKETVGGKAEAAMVTLDASLTVAGEDKHSKYPLMSVAKRRDNLASDFKPTEHEAPLKLPSPNFTQLPPDQRRTEAISTHKQGVITAMENVHSPPKPPQTEYRATIAPHVPKSKSDPLPSLRVPTPLTNHPPPQPKALQEEKMLLESGSKAKPQSPSCKTISVEQFGNVRTFLGEMRDGDRPPSPSHPSHPASDIDTSLYHVYSSKPPTRYGPRPGPDNGVPPATVSLRLARVAGSRPATMHRSRSKGKHSHIHYFTNKT